MKTQRIAFCFVLSLLGCKEQILHNLDELHANRAQVLLSQSGVDADKIKDANGWSIAVPAAAVRRAMRTLEIERLITPDPPPDKGSSSIVPSLEERSFELERQLAASLEHTIQRLPDVLEAHVHIYRKPLSAFESGSEQPGTASVLVVSKRDALPQSEHDIQTIVAGGAGLVPSAVVVIRRDVESESAALTKTEDHDIMSRYAFTSSEQIVVGIVALAALVFVAGSVRGRKQKREKATSSALQNGALPSAKITLDRRNGSKGEAEAF